MNNQEKQELRETAQSWKDNAELFKGMANTKNKDLSYGFNSIARTFETNAMILEALVKDVKIHVNF